MSKAVTPQLRRYGFRGAWSSKTSYRPALAMAPYPRGGGDVPVAPNPQWYPSVMEILLPERLRKKFVIDPNGCWVWTAGLKDGYGQYRHNGQSRNAHRVTYEFLVGPIPEGLVLDHLCRVRRCVNPDHLEPVTNQENNIRGDNPQVAGARQRDKKECPDSHPYNKANTYILPGGGRACRTCARAKHANQRRQRQRLAP